VYHRPPSDSEFLVRSQVELCLERAELAAVGFVSRVVEIRLAGFAGCFRLVRQQADHSAT
jgi:hypothetical protein